MILYKRILIKFKISPITTFTLNDLHQTKVEDTKNSFSPFTGKFIPQIIIRVIIRNLHDIARHRYYKISLKPITRLEANLIAQRALYRLRPRGKLWPGSKSLEIERSPWIRFAQLTSTTMPSTSASSPFFEHLGLSRWQFHLFVAIGFFNSYLKRRGHAKSIQFERNPDGFGRILSIVVVSKYGTRCFKREIN